jgi:hypothetical protein
MRHHDDRRAFLVDLLQQAHDFLTMRGVEIAGRFVGQQHRWPRDQRSGHRDALLLTARQLRRTMSGAMRDA